MDLATDEYGNVWAAGKKKNGDNHRIYKWENDMWRYAYVDGVKVAVDGDRAFIVKEDGSVVNQDDECVTCDQGLVVNDVVMGAGRAFILAEPDFDANGNVVYELKSGRWEMLDGFYGHSMCIF